MQDKVCLITGANAGIGLETARAIAEKGARVVMTARDRAKGEAAVEDVKASTGNDRVSLLELDLASLASVRKAASEFLAAHNRLDMLVNNAGLILQTRQETEDGFEATLGVNHFGHFLFTHLLLDRIEASAPARIVNVSSEAHRQAKDMGFDDLHSKSGYSMWGAYGRSKLANILFTTELAERLEGKGVLVNALHPGVVQTRFGRDGDIGGFMGFAFKVVGPFLTTPAKGARTSVHVATSPSVEGTSGKYFKNSRPVAPSKAALDRDAAKRLWEISVEAVLESR